jgi:hypothetical protein
MHTDIYIYIATPAPHSRNIEQHLGVSLPQSPARSFPRSLSSLSPLALSLFSLTLAVRCDLSRYIFDISCTRSRSRSFSFSQDLVLDVSHHARTHTRN